MSVMTAGLVALRVTQRTGCARLLPWKHCLRRYATKYKTAMELRRWNAENKILFGAKKSPSKKKASKDTTIVSLTETASKTSKTKGRKTGKKAAPEMNTVPASALPDFDDSAETYTSTEYSVEKTVLIKEDNRDMFEAENALYNKLLDSGEAYEGSEASASPWESRGTVTIDIPKLSPIPQAKDPPEKVKTDSKVPSTQKSSDDLPLTFQGAEFIQYCPLLPSQFEEVRCSAEEFQQFVQSLQLRVLPTVNMVLNKTRSELSAFFLQRWRKKMIQELGEVGFRKHQEGIIWQGTNLHAIVQQFLSGVPLQDITIQEANRGHWDSLAAVLPEVSEVKAVETNVLHPWLGYRGTLDCIAKYKNTLYLIDWKTSSKPKPLLSNLYDNPLQAAAYLGAVNMSPHLTDKYGVIDQAAIIVAYTNGEPAHVHRIQPALCLHYWREWCVRLHQYWSTVAAEKRV